MSDKWEFVCKALPWVVGLFIGTLIGIGINIGRIAVALEKLVAK